MEGLKKSHSNKYAEDFGLAYQETVSFYDAGVVKNSKKLALSPVVRVNALWMDKDIKVRCEIADTLDKKVCGLQKHSYLDEGAGMYFPYPETQRVSFHQGAVPFSLDLLFLCEGTLIQVEESTKVGSKDSWSCSSADGVIEVTGGFCKEKGVVIGDRILLCAVSERDLKELDMQNYYDGLTGYNADAEYDDNIGFMTFLSDVI